MLPQKTAEVRNTRCKIYDKLQTKPRDVHKMLANHYKVMLLSMRGLTNVVQCETERHFVSQKACRNKFRHVWINQNAVHSL